MMRMLEPHGPGLVGAVALLAVGADAALSAVGGALAQFLSEEDRVLSACGEGFAESRLVPEWLVAYRSEDL